VINGVIKMTAEWLMNEIWTETKEYTLCLWGTMKSGHLFAWYWRLNAALLRYLPVKHYPNNICYHSTRSVFNLHDSMMRTTGCESQLSDRSLQSLSRRQPAWLTSHVTL